jgi:hypothetical protein
MYLKGMEVTADCVNDLLSEKIPHTVEGNSVFFDYAEGKYLAAK